MEVGIKDIKKEEMIFIFKYVFSGAELANPSWWFLEIFTAIGSEIKNTINQFINKTTI